MVISVHADPAHPRGGYAVLSLPEGSLDAETVQVAVFDNYSERYLGDKGWQPSKVLFGPYTVQLGEHGCFVVVGPEIVNQIEEYANVRIEVAHLKQNVSWPDEVVPAPSAARVGGIVAAGTTVAEKSTAMDVQMPQDATAATPAMELQAPHDAAEVEGSQPKGNKSSVLLTFLVLLVAAAALAYWFLWADREPDEPYATTKTIATVPDDPCGAAELRKLDGFASQLDALRGCGNAASADTALGLVERGAAADDPDALMLFGTVYDGAVTDEGIEKDIGLTFGDVPATAAEYYARAAQAGSEEAEERLTNLCIRMADMTDTLTQGAVADYCGQ